MQKPTLLNQICSISTLIMSSHSSESCKADESKEPTSKEDTIIEDDEYDLLRGKHLKLLKENSGEC